MPRATKLKEKLSGFFRSIYSRALYLLLAKVYFGKNPASISDNSIIFFPISTNILFCGFAGIVAYKNSVAWDDKYIEFVGMRSLFGISAEKISEIIVAKIGG
ncbi:MAG: hypothetical protein ACNYWU_02710 [Desulfobacterales bacterium]